MAAAAAAAAPGVISTELTDLRNEDEEKMKLKESNIDELMIVLKKRGNKRTIFDIRGVFPRNKKPVLILFSRN